MTETARYIELWGESTNIPGIAVNTNTFRRYGYGPTERKPYTPIFVDTNMSFYVDGAGMIQKFFYKWMNGIVKFDETINGKGVKYGSTTLQPFEVNYKDQYATDILITFVYRIAFGGGVGANYGLASAFSILIFFIVVFISDRANKIKQDGTEKELYAVADWLHKKRKEVSIAFS